MRTLTQLFACSLLALGCLMATAGPALADEGTDPRRLKLNLDGEVSYLSMQQLQSDYPAQTLDVFDLDYRADHSYQGFDFWTFLEQSEIDPSRPLMLVCADGYSIHFDPSGIDKSRFQGLLATADLAAAEGENWLPFRHGREDINFDPFYLVWAVKDAGPQETYETELNTLPWPFQLTEIRYQNPSDYEPAQPSERASAQIHAGFEVYVNRCAKCHQIKGVGGTVAPSLDRPEGMAALLPVDMLTRLVRNVTEFFPESKMTNFSNTLAEEDLHAVVAYMKWVNQP